MTTKGRPSKTHHGDKAYTTKQGDKNYHRRGHLVKGTPYCHKRCVPTAKQVSKLPPALVSWLRTRSAR